MFLFSLDEFTFVQSVCKLFVYPSTGSLPSSATLSKITALSVVFSNESNSTRKCIATLTSRTEQETTKGKNMPSTLAKTSSLALCVVFLLKNFVLCKPFFHFRVFRVEINLRKHNLFNFWLSPE